MWQGAKQTICHISYEEFFIRQQPPQLHHLPFLHYVQCCKCQYQEGLTDDCQTNTHTHTPPSCPNTHQWTTLASLISLAFFRSVSHPTFSVGLISDYVRSLIQMDPCSDTHPPHPTPHLTSDLMVCCLGNLFGGDEKGGEGMERWGEPRRRRMWVEGGVSVFGIPC